jgi:hypothetical protein
MINSLFAVGLDLHYWDDDRADFLSGVSNSYGAVSNNGVYDVRGKWLMAGHGLSKDKCRAGVR